MREQLVEPGQKFVARHLFACEHHGFALHEAKRRAQWFDGPCLARRAPAACAFARRFPAIDLAAGHGQPEQVLVDRVGLLLRAHAEATFFQVLLLVGARLRSEEHTSELQSLMRISYAVFCLKKKNKNNYITETIKHN